MRLSHLTGTALLALLPATAAAHVNDRGMNYERYRDSRGVSCCNVHDCEPAADFVEASEAGQAVVRLLVDGLWITVPKSFVVDENATDGRAHWCGTKLFDGPRTSWRPSTFCVILPPRGS